MHIKLHSEPGLRSIKEREHVNLIMEFLKMFTDDYEKDFGLIEEAISAPAGQIAENTTVYIRSTGYAPRSS